MSKAREGIARSGAAQRPSPFIEGYLTQLFDSGKEPQYGYPKNHLPETSDGDMEVVTGYLASPPSSIR
jgi:hypothetical protein